MRFELDFGRLAADGPAPIQTDRFRIALLGDFSGRAVRGGGDDDAADPSALGRRRPIPVDVDDLDDELERLGIVLHLDVPGGTVAVPITCMDDFHPDELVENVDLFEAMLSLRRRLDSGRWESAAKEVMGWTEDADDADDAPARSERGRDDTAIPARGGQGDLERLLGGSVGEHAEPTDADDLIRGIVTPFVVDARDPKQDELIERVDAAIAGAMRSILHHPTFRAVEAAWRTVEWLVRNLETGTDLSIVLHDMTAAELTADLAAHDDLAETGLHRLLIEQPRMDANQGPPSIIAGLFVFEQTPPHAELLGRLARLAAAAGAPFVSALGREVIRKFDPDKLPSAVVEAWAALRGLPESAYLGLTTPRFLLRAPYGKRSDPVDAFAFEEFTRTDGLRTMLWGNGAALLARLLAANASRNGMNGMRPEAMLSVGDMPFHWFTDDHGDQVALPCTEQMLSERMASWVSGQGCMPVLSVRGRPEVRLGGVRSVGGDVLAGPWAPVDVSAASASAEAPVEAAAPAAAAPVEEPADDESPATDDDDLDALLASLSDDDDEPAAADDATDDDADDAGDEDMDPELAALLEGL